MVEQRSTNDCMIAAIATVVGKTHKSVKNRYAEQYGKIKGGIEYKETLWLLSEFGEFTETYLPKGTRLFEWLGSHREGRFVVSVWMDKLECHAIAVVDGITDLKCLQAEIACVHELVSLK